MMHLQCDFHVHDCVLFFLGLWGAIDFVVASVQVDAFSLPEGVQAGSKGCTTDQLKPI
jgi:hypothetical protein